TTNGEYSYDAWGRMRNPSTWAVYAVGSEPSLYLGRGYTGHEHLPMFGLVNMNARLYDPVLGRFLAPDPYVQGSDFSQSYNRYGYCMNNPMKYVDEDGEFAHWLAAGLIGGTFNWMTHGFKFTTEGLSYFGAGFVAGALVVTSPNIAQWAYTGLNATNSVIEQGFSNGWSNINYKMIGIDLGIDIALNSTGINILNKTSGAFGNVMKGIKSPLLKEFIVNQSLVVPLNAFIGGLKSIDDGDSFWDGAWQSSKDAFISSLEQTVWNVAGMSYHYKTNPFTGNPILPKTNSNLNLSRSTHPEQFNYSPEAQKTNMSKSAIPEMTLRDAIESGDSHSWSGTYFGPNAKAYESIINVNGKDYYLRVLYDPSSKTILRYHRQRHPFKR
ncbi:MAG: RHS repeat-associated core domain-containing protein, partial [Bacteroidaceae bacterium]|nr:RHS repeat-associated core domain-containing protein [Bacteroidaceae bacterium]